ncbi:hypothetical protein BDW62DRAFT_184898, partial [Aspergillus aurantiobrunneus]
ATFEASNLNSTSLQPLVYVPRVGPALRPKLTSRPLQYLARVRDRSGREVP